MQGLIVISSVTFYAHVGRAYLTIILTKQIANKFTNAEVGNGYFRGSFIETECTLGWFWCLWSGLLWPHQKMEQLVPASPVGGWTCRWRLSETSSQSSSTRNNSWTWSTSTLLLSSEDRLDQGRPRRCCQVRLILLHLSRIKCWVIRSLRRRCPSIFWITTSQPVEQPSATSSSLNREESAQCL